MNTRSLNLAAESWHAENSQGMVHEVSQRAPNKILIHDLFGNAEELYTVVDPILLYSGKEVDPNNAIKLASFGGSAKTPPKQLNNKHPLRIRRTEFSPSDRNPLRGFRVVASQNPLTLEKPIRLEDFAEKLIKANQAFGDLRDTLDVARNQFGHAIDAINQGLLRDAERKAIEDELERALKRAFGG
jgi:hypothetical protein